jgi:hypothetical protein
MKGVSTLWRTRSVHRPEAEFWVDESGRIALLGEAAHPAYVGALFFLSLSFFRRQPDCFFPARLFARRKYGYGRHGRDWQTLLAPDLL